jgi:hypothetical protein
MKSVFSRNRAFSDLAPYPLDPILPNAALLRSQLRRDGGFLDGRAMAAGTGTQCFGAVFNFVRSLCTSAYPGTELRTRKMPRPRSVNCPLWLAQVDSTCCRGNENAVKQRVRVIGQFIQESTRNILPIQFFRVRRDWLGHRRFEISALSCVFVYLQV